jgi:predicted nucleic acid-binding protein
LSDGFLCVDASVAVKWLIRERHSDRALALLSNALLYDQRLVSPSHFVPEITSAIFKRARSGEIAGEHARQVAISTGQLAVQTVAPPTLPLRAFEIATQFNLKWIYDAFYVALAEIVGCDLWTADEKLHESVNDAFPNVRLLAHYHATSR